MPSILHFSSRQTNQMMQQSIGTKLMTENKAVVSSTTVENQVEFPLITSIIGKNINIGFPKQTTKKHSYLHIAVGL